MQQGERKEAEMDGKARLIDKELPEATIYTDTSENARRISQERPVSCRARISLALLVFINFINYMDRLTIAGKNNRFFCANAPSIVALLILCYASFHNITIIGFSTSAAMSTLMRYRNIFACARVWALSNMDADDQSSGSLTSSLKRNKAIQVLTICKHFELGLLKKYRAKLRHTP